MKRHKPKPPKKSGSFSPLPATLEQVKNERRKAAAKKRTKPKKKKKWQWSDIEKHKQKARARRKERAAEGKVTWTKELYVAYLKSDHWKALRTRKYASEKPCQCSICGSTKDLQVHHLQYKNVYDVLLEDLRVFCDRCHDLTHELLRSGVLKIRAGASSDDIFALTKAAVKKVLTVPLKNLFCPPDGTVQ